MDDLSDDDGAFSGPSLSDDSEMEYADSDVDIDASDLHNAGDIAPRPANIDDLWDGTDDDGTAAMAETTHSPSADNPPQSAGCNLDLLSDASSEKAAIDELSDCEFAAADRHAPDAHWTLPWKQRSETVKTSRGSIFGARNLITSLKRRATRSEAALKVAKQQLKSIGEVWNRRTP